MIFRRKYTNYISSAIAVHTFVVLWMRKGEQNVKAALCVIAASWIFVILLAIVPLARVGSKKYYGPTPVRIHFSVMM